MEAKEIKVLMPADWKPTGTYTLAECAALHLYLTEKQKKVAEAEKNGKKITFFKVADIVEMFKYDEVTLKNPKQTYMSYFIDDRCKPIVQDGHIAVLLGITDTCKVMQVQYPSPAEQYNKYTELLYSYLYANQQLLGREPKIAEIPDVSKPIAKEKDVAITESSSTTTTQ